MWPDATHFNRLEQGKKEDRIDGFVRARLISLEEPIRAILTCDKTVFDAVGGEKRWISG
jgi:hypothetical protein